MRFRGVLPTLGCLLLAGWSIQADGPHPTNQPAKPPAKREPTAVARLIDQEIDRRLQAEKLLASPQADDAEFCRRVHIDIIGRIPTYERTVAFLADTAPGKRKKLVDELLERPEYGQHFATIWTNLTIGAADVSRIVKEAARVSEYRAWLAEQFNRNPGWDRMVRELLTSSGNVREHPPATFLLSYASPGDLPMPGKMVEASSELFLGIRFRCAECHEHRGQYKVENWRQNDFWGLAAFFSRVRFKGGSSKGGKGWGDASVSEDDVPWDQQYRRDAPPKSPPTWRDGSIGIPEDPNDIYTKTKATVRAKFLEGLQPELGDQPFRPILAAWMTSPNNKYFARAAVNRWWEHFFGRGLVAPIDLMHETNKPSHPDLFHAFSEEFKASGFDLKHLIRCICNSRAYQRTSRPVPGNQEDKVLLSHMAIKPMRPEVLIDSLAIAGVKLPGRPGQLAEFFGSKELSPDRTQLGYGMPQLLRIMNAQPNISGKLLAGKREEVIEKLYLNSLGRRPDEAEMKLMAAYAAQSKNGFAEVYWILLNSAEFMLNH